MSAIQKKAKANIYENLNFKISMFKMVCVKHLISSRHTNCDYVTHKDNGSILQF